MVQKVFDFEQKKGSGGQPEPKGQKLKIKGLIKFLIHNNLTKIGN